MLSEKVSKIKRLREKTSISINLARTLLVKCDWDEALAELEAAPYVMLSRRLNSAVSNSRYFFDELVSSNELLKEVLEVLDSIDFNEYPSASELNDKIYNHLYSGE